MTVDLDLIVELTHANKESFTNLFDDNYYMDKSAVNDEIARQGMFNVIDFETGFKIDFIIRKDTEYRQVEFTRKKMLI